jgi:DNA invertase Pin-like site-specific DNA recombinase
MTRKTRRAIASVIDKAIKRLLKGAFYGRVSNGDQAFELDGSVRSDGSTEAQRTRCFYYVDHLSQKTGIKHTLVEFITDLAFSGKNTNRPGFQKLWKLIAEGEIDFVIAAELSRLSRSVADFLSFLAHCEKHGVAVFIVGLDLDTSSPFGRMMVVVLVALAQFEREMVAMRVRENAAARLLRDGKINGSAPILGLDRDPARKGHFIKNAEGLKKVEQLLRLYVAFGSKKKVLGEARRLGIADNRGEELTPYMLDHILSNCKWRYRGLWFANLENKGDTDLSLPDSKRFQVVQLPHGPLIDIELLDQVQRILDDPARRHKRAGSKGYVYLLSHILVHTDGSRFTGASAKSGAYRYYLNPDLRLRIHCQDLDSVVLQTLKDHLLESEQFQSIVCKALKPKGPTDPKTGALKLLETLHKLPGAAQRTFIETLVKQVIVGDGCLTIELYGHEEPTTVAGKPHTAPAKSRRTKKVGGQGDE